MIRICCLAALSLLAWPCAAAAETCLPYGAAHTTLTGGLYAFEAFDEAEAEDVGRTRQADYYALVLPARVCLEGKRGDPRRPPAFHVTIVRLALPAARAAALLGRQVRATGPLSHSADPAADPAIAMTVRAVEAVE